MKQCKKCKKEKSLEGFWNKSSEKDGKHRYCIECQKIEGSKYYHNKGKHSRSDYYKIYREENKEYFNKYSHNHYHSNKELYREWNRNKYQEDIGFRIKHIVAARISAALKTYQVLKNDRTIEYLGCSIGDYMNYLESMFDENMTWENQGEYWEIDHIKPIASFDLNNEDELYSCFHYTNTQPMEALENRLKSDKR